MLKYKVIAPMLPPPEERCYPDFPMMTADDMTYWLNKMAEDGWHIVTYGARHWPDIETQDWWIFVKGEE